MSRARFVPRLCLATALAGALPALAVDGVLEINQAKALAGDVTAGDAPGFPVTLSQPGSYRLTSNLAGDGGDGGAAAVIQITTSSVSLDLNGFEIAGLVNGSNSDCITASPGSYDTRVFDGEVGSCDASALRLLHGAVAERLTVVNTGGQGILVDGGGRVLASSFVDTRGGAIAMSAGLVRDVVVFSASEVPLFGIELDSGTIESVHSVYPIALGWGLVRGSTVSSGGGATALSCTQCGITGNVFLDCATGTCVVGAAEIPVGSNLCGGNPCP
jgi:hypothetical protein